MGCKGIKSELNSTLFDCYVRNPTQKATPFSLDYLRNQIKSRLIMTYNTIYSIIISGVANSTTPIPLGSAT